MPLLITVCPEGDRLVVALAGDLDVATGFDVRDQLSVLVREYGCRDLLLDLERLEFLDCSGARAIAWLLELVRDRGGALAVRHLPDQARRLLDLVELTPFLWIEESSVERAD